MRMCRRLIGILLTVVMLFSMIPVTFAAATNKYSDFPTGWSSEAMAAAVNNGILNGFEDGTIRPKANLTRAQFAAIITRAFGAETKADVAAYKDVLTGEWYYDDIAKAVKMGALNGRSATQMDPDAPITRQETFTAVARILVLSSNDMSVLDKFNDKGQIASWAAEYMAALTQRGYINGDHESNSNPEDYISREEFAQFMHNAIRTYITEPGTYNDDLEGITVVRVGDVSLKNLKITSDLIIGDGVGEGNVEISGVNIAKRLLARGGTIKVTGSTLGDFVVVNNVNGTTYFKNYRNETFFKGIVENTKAQFLTYSSHWSGGSGGTTPPNPVVYTLTLMVDGVVYDTITVTNGIPNKSVSDPTKDYYTFDGWYDAGGNKVTDFGSVTATQVITARFIAIPYGVTFAGDPAFTWKDAYTPITSFTVDELTTKELPPGEKVKAPLGYIFEYWKINGNRVDSLKAIKDGGYLPKATSATITITAHYSLKEYRVEYSGVTWKAGCAPTVLTYNITNVNSYVLPSGDDVEAPSGQRFQYWKNANTGVRVDKLTITDDTADLITLTPHFEPEIIPSNRVTVTFYSRYSNSPLAIIGTPLSIERGTKVDEGAFPNAHEFVREGYKEDANVASIYAGNEWIHKITPEFWYVKDGVMTAFDETVEVNEDTNVYLLSKSLSLMLTYEAGGTVQALQVSADYNKDTRIVNSVKDIIAKSGKQQLELALANNMIPKYDEMVADVVDKMVSAGVIELDGDKKNVQIIDVPFKISTFVKEDIANNMSKKYLRDVVKNPAELDKIFSLIDVSEFADQLGIDITAFVDEQSIKDYVAGLSDAEKTAFADDIFAALQNNKDYKTFMNQLLKGDSVVVNKSNASMLTVIATTIRGLTFDSVIDFIDNSMIDKLKNAIGEDYIKALYDEMLTDYCDGLDAVINEVNLASSETFEKSYTTSLKLRLNIFEIYERLYDNAFDKAKEKLENANIYYNENEYLKFLVEQDFLSYLVDGDKALANGDFTGYSLKGVMDYYNYLVMLLIVGDDAVTWYGDETNNLSEAQFEALYDAMFDKLFAVHESMNDILIAFKDDGKLPAQVQSAVESVKQLNSLILNASDEAKAFIEKYLNSNLNLKFEDESIAEEGKVVKTIDWLVGKDDPVVNIGTIYETIYEYDEVVQEKLKQLVESDKFKQALDKFETATFGEMFSGKGQLGTIADKLDELRNNGRIESALDSVYDFFYLVANEGLDAFKVPAAEMKVTDIDIYKVKIGKVEIAVQRAYR